VREGWSEVALGALAVAALAACQNLNWRSPGAVAAETQASAHANVTTATAAQILAAIQVQTISPAQPAVAQAFANTVGGGRGEIEKS
jgi:hypothetical protein